ncbi:DNA mismatch repair protein MutS [Buchnera aphidicola (Tetraneura ulmi)]|uniref:DNA mismatch repair protein MutS n=1 Tax=Buchnera aphidicola TaxID=9 RepID=UPI0034643EDA
MKNYRTPMMKQYFLFKKKYPKMIIFYQMGDFYEVFFEDAKKVSSLLNITLTKRGHSSDNDIPMAGVPCSNINFYLLQLIKNGEKVVICDQIKNSFTKFGILERKVVRIITPGTVLDEELLDGNNDVLLAALYQEKDRFSYSTLDLSSGRFKIFECQNFESLQSKIELTNPNELLYPENSNIKKIMKNRKGLNPKPIYYFDSFVTKNQLKIHFGKKKLEEFGIKDEFFNLKSAGCLFKYVQSMHNNSIMSHVRKIKFIKDNEYIEINSSTIKNLEIIKNVLGTGDNSLLSTLDKTSTKMGSRMLKRWLCFPIRDISIIKSRQSSISDLKNIFLKIQKYLSQMGDLERIVGRISLKIALPRDFILLRNSIELFPKINFILLKTKNENLKKILKKITFFPNLYFLLKKCISDNPSNSIRHGGVIAENYNSELDELRKLKSMSESLLKNIELEEKKRLGIESLKIGFNSLIGYFIQINKKYSNIIPLYYVKKQSIKHSNRYTFPLLQKYQKRFLESEIRIIALEKMLYEELFDHMLPYIVDLQKAYIAISELDVLTNLSERSVTLNYICPKVSNKNILFIKNGRHPVIENIIGVNFVKNSVKFCKNKRIFIITGPNMGGKSTYMRQIALISILTWIGSFVPAESATVGIIDKIFTRIGASDNLSYGQSTFMVEIKEMVSILNNATKNSLVIIDEIGRGTSIIDGFSLAWSCIKYLIEKINCMTLFSTHYFKITELSSKYNSIENLFFKVLKKNKKTFFLYKVQSGVSNKSYGLLVSSLAGLPKLVIKEAKKKMKEIERNEIALKKRLKIIKNLESLIPEKISPIEALNYIFKIKKMLKKNIYTYE